MAKTPEEAANYILTIFGRHNILTGGTVLMNNLTLPFAQDGWTLEDLEAGQAYGVEKGWIEIGKGAKFVKLTAAGNEIVGGVTLSHFPKGK